MTVCAAPARAGSYSVSLSGGGSVEYDGTGYNSYDDNGDSGTADVDYLFDDITGVYSVSGPITVTCTWVPDYPNEPPPQTVILDERSSASFEVNGGTDLAGGTCDDGIGDPAVPNLQGLPYAISRGERVTAHGGGASFSFTRAPSITPGSDGGINGDITYSVSIDPVTIDPVGATQDDSGGWNILIGQYCHPVLEAAGTPSNYQWSVSGPTFQNWASQSAFDLSASFYDDGPGVLDVDDPGWYWHEIGRNTSKSETISCTATVTPPAGQGSAFTVSASQPITVWVPDWIAFGLGGYVRVGEFDADSGYQMYAAPLAAAAGTGGMNMAASVSAPQYATYADGSPLFGDGSLVLVQLVTPNMSYLYIDAEAEAIRFYDWSENGQEGLDNGYPYPQYQNGPNYRWRDSPYIGLADQSVTNVDMDDAFQAYLMYFPPASTQCVPIARFIWDANGKADLPSGGVWSNYASDHGGSDSAGTVTPSGNASLFLPYNEFPMWTQIDGQGSFGFGVGATVSSAGF